MINGKGKEIMDDVRETVRHANTGRNCEQELAFIEQRLAEERDAREHHFAEKKKEYVAAAQEKIEKLEKENMRLKVLLNATADFISEHVEKPE